jgi:hypothetical protein
VIAGTFFCNNDTGVAGFYPDTCFSPVMEYVSVLVVPVVSKIKSINKGAEK